MIGKFSISSPGFKTRIKPYVLLFLYFLLTAILGTCTRSSHQETSAIHIPEGPPHEKLSKYRFFKGEMKNLAPVEGLLPYDLNTPLFSDYAQKQRFIYIPEDSSAAYHPQKSFSFPEGSVLIKNFFYADDLRNPDAGRTLIETRLLIHKADGWTADTYVWNTEQTDATLQKSGSIKPVTWTDRRGTSRKVQFLIPTKNDCKVCHQRNNRIVPLGPTGRNLNRTYTYEDGAKNQLEKWKQASFLADSPDPGEAPRLPVWDEPSTGSVEKRARAYLHVNCANCHNPEGSANYSGLYLEYEEQNPNRLGIYKAPVAPGRGSGNLKYDIVPGHPGRSILVHRMVSSEPDVRMPEIGRTLVHQEAVSLIVEWIKNLDTASDSNRN